MMMSEVLVAGCGIAWPAHAKRLGEHPDRGQRRLQLVRHARDELRAPVRPPAAPPYVAPQKVSAERGQREDQRQRGDVEPLLPEPAAETRRLRPLVHLDQRQSRQRTGPGGCSSGRRPVGSLSQAAAARGDASRSGLQSIKRAFNASTASPEIV